MILQKSRCFDMRQDGPLSVLLAPLNGPMWADSYSLSIACVLCIYQRTRSPMKVSRFTTLKIPDYLSKLVTSVTISACLLWPNAL